MNINRGTSIAFDAMNEPGKQCENIKAHNKSHYGTLGAKSAIADHRQIGGNHYKSMDVTPWEAMEAWMSPEAFKGFLLGNVIKYLTRTKDDVREDHKKAAHYLQKLIEIEDTKK
mgnify:CR=1 FL=1